MKSIYLSVLFIILLTSFSNKFKTFGNDFIFNERKTLIKKVSLNELEIQNSDLVIIIDSLLSTIPNYNKRDTVYLNVDIYNYSWKVGEKCILEDTMIVGIHYVSKNSCFSKKEKKGFFIFNNIIGTVSGILIPSLFTKSGKIKEFNYEEDNSESTIKVGSYENFAWYFYYVDGEFYETIL